MHVARRTRRLSVVLSLAALLAGLMTAIGASVGTAAPSGTVQRYLVRVNAASNYDAVRARAVSLGAKVAIDLPEANTFVAVSSGSQRSQLSADSRVAGVASDHVESIAVPERGTMPSRMPDKLPRTYVRLAGPASPATGSSITPDPAFGYQGLQWDYNRIGLPQGWDTSTGAGVTVGVADTGLDYTHPELASKVTQVLDFTQTEDPPLCKTFFGFGDRQLARQFGGPRTTDWNGHGSWIGGNIGAALDSIGQNGTAFGVDLVSLKISGWCGSAYDSTILQAFHYAAAHGIPVVSISFGGYLDRSDPAQDMIWQDYADVVAFAKTKGTVIVAAAGNEHAQIGTDGLVLTHGTLVAPGATPFDAFGQYEVPGGIPGVVDVSSTNNRVIDTSTSCPPGTEGSTSDFNATCKRSSDTHQPFGARTEDQLAYYSNYGPRIDVAGPGGGRKFNLPYWDRGGTPGFPYTTADLTNAWEDFSITSDWAISIPCFIMGHGSGFYQHCYSTIQGTSMATPHASAVAALLLASDPSLQGDVDALVAAMKASAIVPATNHTPPIDPTDTSTGDLTGVACGTGNCHLGGAAISNAEAYGAGLVQVPGA